MSLPSTVPRAIRGSSVPTAAPQEARLPAQPLAPAARWTLASLALGIALSALGVSIANVALPTLAQAFDAPLGDVQWVVLAYLLAITTLIVGVGRVGDLFGRRRSLLWGIGLYASGSLLCGLAPSLGLLVAARALQGLGAAAMMALALAMVGSVVPRERTGAAMGLLGSMSAVGTAIGPTAGGLLLATWGWPSLFWVTALGGAVAWWLARRFLPADAPRGKAGDRIDVSGIVLLALALAAYAAAMTVGRGHFGWANLALLAAAAALGYAFARAQAGSAAPLLQLALLRDPVLRAGLAGSGLVTSVVMATLVVGPYYLSAGLGLEAAQVGIVMSCGPVVAALAGLPAGRLVDRLGVQRVAVTGLLTMALGSALLPLLAPPFAMAGYVAALVLVTAGYAAYQAANNATVMLQVRDGQRGIVSAMLHLARNLGLITGASLMAALYATGAGTGNVAATSAAAATAGLRLTFGVAVLLVLAALGIAMLAGRRVPQQARQA